VTSSLLDSLVSLNVEERQQILATLTDEQAAALLYDWRFWARPEQVEPVGGHSIWLVLAGRGYGKTRLGAEWVREQVKTRGRVNLIGQDAAAVRSIMIEGESGIMAVCPPWERPEYLKSQRLLRWPNGAISECRSGEDPEGVRGLQHEALWADELAAWQYVDDTWDMAVLGLRLGDDPRALVTTTPKPIPLLRELIEDPSVQVTKGKTYDNRPNLAPTFFSQLITKYEGTRLGRQELDAELLLDEGLAYRVVHGVHIVPVVTVPEHWQRYESMDYGAQHPTAWPVFAIDYDGNTVVFDMYYSPGLVSDHAAEVLRRRRRWWPGENDVESVLCFGPPDIRQKRGISEYGGREITVESQFAAHGITFAAAQTDRRAGYMRIAELLKVEEDRRFPEWHPRAGEPGAPRLFIVDCDATAPLVKQLRDAPLESPDSPLSRWPGEAVAEGWEGEDGHAHAALRYGLLSRGATRVRRQQAKPKTGATA
jgi:hypothetical protein